MPLRARTAPTSAWQKELACCAGSLKLGGLLHAQSNSSERRVNLNHPHPDLLTDLHLERGVLDESISDLRHVHHALNSAFAGGVRKAYEDAKVHCGLDRAHNPLTLLALEA